MSRNVPPKERSLAAIYPKLAAEWHPVRNAPRSPYDISAKSGIKVWWQCEKGHEWQAVVANRSRENCIGCLYCAGKKAAAGENDLATLMPEIAAEWDYEKNDGLTPEMVTTISNKRVGWKCKYGHEWSAVIHKRILKKGIGCPYCSGRRLIVGTNDLATLMPKVAAEWDYEKNDGLTPEMVAKSAHKKVWWKCKHGHKWQADVRNRTGENGAGCPYCSGRYAVIGENDLVTFKPEIVSEWNYERNNGLTPEMFAKYSNQKVWWRCKFGHEWRTQISNRTRKETGCPYCSGRRLVIGENDLATLEPQIAAEWDHEKNRGMKPERFGRSSCKKVWWRCQQGHEWRIMISKRTLVGAGCPECSKSRVSL